MNLAPPSYPEERLSRCLTCHEYSVDPREGTCLDPSCPSHALCEWCRERKAVTFVQTAAGTEDRLCAACGLQAVREMLREGKI